MAKVFNENNNENIKQDFWDKLFGNPSDSQNKLDILKGYIDKYDDIGCLSNPEGEDLDCDILYNLIYVYYNPRNKLDYHLVQSICWDLINYIIENKKIYYNNNFLDDDKNLFAHIFIFIIRGYYYDYRIIDLIMKNSFVEISQKTLINELKNIINMYYGYYYDVESIDYFKDTIIIPIKYLLKYIDINELNVIIVSDINKIEKYFNNLR